MLVKGGGWGWLRLGLRAKWDPTISGYTEKFNDIEKWCATRNLYILVVQELVYKVSPICNDFLFSTVIKSFWGQETHILKKIHEVTLDLMFCS